MNAIVLLASHRPPKPLDDRRLVFPASADNDRLDQVGTCNGPEPAMTVRFIGIDEMAQRRALASFPGGRRCTLAVA
ncbi:MAG: hypothetical protein P4M09_00310 [Devosia sp.]|nr:hypothetical protein [Devosia sp.]